MSKKSCRTFIYLLCQKIFDNMGRFKYFEVYDRRAFHKLESIAGSSVGAAVEAIRLRLGSSNPFPSVRPRTEDTEKKHGDLHTFYPLNTATEMREGLAAA